MIAASAASESRTAASGLTAPAALGKRGELVVLVVVLLVAAAFRLPALSTIPNGLFLDEASRGYDAYSLLLTGRDQYGVRWPLFAEGLDDYTPVLYTLLVIPSVAAIGLNEVAVRLPAAIIGIATVATTYLAGRAYFGAVVGLVAAGLLAISPWHILPSRTGAEWVLLPYFTTTGVWLLAHGRRSGPALLAAGLVLGVGLYSYAFARLLIPMLVGLYALLWWRDLVRRPVWSTLSLAAFVALAVPLVSFGLTAEGQARLRAMVPLDRYQGLALVPYFLGNVVSYFTPWFLVTGGEPTNHHRLRGFGPILPVMVPLLLAALVSAVRRPDRATMFWFGWIVAAPLSAALHRESPSSVLLLGAIPAWQVLAAFGAVRLVGWLRARSMALAWAGIGLILAGVGVTAMMVATNLYAEYPVYAADDWLYGARETVDYLESQRQAYDDVVVSDRIPAAQVLVLFHAKMPPATYQAAPIHVRQPNVRARGTVGQYEFGRTGDLLDRPGRHLAWVVPDEERGRFAGQKPLFEARLPDGRAVYRVYAVEGR